jgi:hypothetical protein
MARALNPLHIIVVGFGRVHAGGALIALVNWVVAA